jgi:hypothetical protein
MLLHTVWAAGHKFSTVRFKLVGQAPRHPDRPVTVFDTGEL